MRVNENIESLVRALRCLGAQDSNGDCYMGYYNSVHFDEILDGKCRKMVCFGKNEDKTVCCPFHQNKYDVCFEDGECSWLSDVADIIQEQQYEIEQLEQQVSEAMELLELATKDIVFFGDRFGCAGCDGLKPDWSDNVGDWRDCPFASDKKDECREDWKYQDRYEKLKGDVENEREQRNSDINLSELLGERQ